MQIDKIIVVVHPIKSSKFSVIIFTGLKDPGMAHFKPKTDDSIKYPQHMFSGETRKFY